MGLKHSWRVGKKPSANRQPLGKQPFLRRVGGLAKKVAANLPKTHAFLRGWRLAGLAPLKGWRLSANPRSTRHEKGENR